MSTPIIELIALDIVTAITAITTGNGFNQTLTALRPRRVDYKDTAPKDGTVYVWQGDAEEASAQTFPLKAWIQPFKLVAIVIDSDATATSIDTRLNQVRSDIEKKLMEDVGRSGLANGGDGTVIRAPEKFDEGPSYTGITVNIEVQYRTLETDPYTQ